eukprot:2977929-Pleurochrysis_carterae.AAC.1
MCPSINCHPPSCASGYRVSASLAPSSGFAGDVPLRFPLAYTLADCRSFTRALFYHSYTSGNQTADRPGAASGTANADW